MFCAAIFGLASGAGLPYMANQIFPRIFPEEGEAAAAVLSTWELLGYTLWLPAVFAVRGLGDYGNAYLINLCGARILEAIRLEFFTKLQALPLAFFRQRHAGDLISRGMADTNQLQITVTTVANEAFKQPITLLSALGYIIWLAAQDSNVLVILGGLALIPVTVFPIRYVGQKVLRRARQVQEEMGSATSRFSENLNAVQEVRAFNLEDREIKRFSATTHQLLRVQMKVVKYSRMLSPSIEVLSAIGISITLVLAYRLSMQLEPFISLVTALYMSYGPVKKLGAMSNELRRGEAALDRIEAVLNEPVSITDPTSPETVGRLRGEISFSGVEFAYAAEPVLRDVSITIPAGTVCALVGPSGAGKSTFANLVPRFYDAVQGVVAVDGIDVRRMRLADLRRNIAIVSQEPVLFHDTVYNNLLIGRTDATREEVEAAARDAFIHDFITALPQGYETIVGDRGATLSGGQRQRLALARAFLRSAPILILDEATSALDAQSEEMIQQALSKLVVGKTVIIIAHRFSTIRCATQILVFDQGCIVAAGDHETLLRDNELYRTLYNRQR